MMRHIFIFLTMIFLGSCRQIGEPNSTAQKIVSRDSINKPDITSAYRNKGNETIRSTTNNWERHEDSLRNIILKNKKNKIVKEGFLQELYIRNVVVVSEDSLFFNIPFNLHGPDCGAPDCYSTDISFSFKLGSKLAFPKILQFEEYEHGCVDEEKYLTGNFRLVEQTNKYIIYHSTSHRQTLVLFSSNKDNGTTAYYFTQVGQNRVSRSNLYSIIDGYKERVKNPVYPFTSWILTTNEYENFLK